MSQLRGTERLAPANTALTCTNASYGTESHLHYDI